MRFAAVIIGDELLSGRRQDRHMAALIERLYSRGFELEWVRMVGDQPRLLVRTLSETFAGEEVVFCFGGIGATPDDRTRHCCAQALGVPLVRHPQAAAALREQFGEQATEARLRMVDFPAGAAMIPNPVNRVAGFSIAEHHFVPGFPSMAWPMVEWVLDTRYRDLQQPGRVVQRSVRVLGAREGAMIPLLERLERDFSELRISCLPSGGSGGCGFEVELGLRGAAGQVDRAFSELCIALDATEYRWEALPPATFAAPHGPNSRNLSQ